MRSIAVIVASSLATAASAGLGPVNITVWNFNGASGTTVPGGTASPSPDSGVGTASLVGGTTGGFNSGIVDGGSSDPQTTSPPNYAWNIMTFPAPGTGDLTRGLQFMVSTVGYEQIHVQWDQRNSNTASRWVQFQYTTDGVNFTDAGLADDGVFQINEGITWFNGLTASLSSIEGVSNNPNFGFRFLATFGPGGQYEGSETGSPYGSAGTWRFDMVKVIGVPPDKGVPGDLNEDGFVDGDDLAVVLGGWGPCADCIADVNDDGVVDGNDLTVVLGQWNPEV